LLACAKEISSMTLVFFDHFEHWIILFSLNEIPSNYYKKLLFS